MTVNERAFAKLGNWNSACPANIALKRGYLKLRKCCGNNGRPRTIADKCTKGEVTLSGPNFAKCLC